MVVRRLVIAANLAYAVALLIFGLIPSVPDVVARVPDHGAHAVAYAAQAALLYIFFLPSGGRNRAALLALGGAVLYGGCVEVLQSFQPARTVEVADLVANTVGAAAVSAVLYLASGRRATEIGP